MVKILHIGPTDGSHIFDVVQQIKENTNFDNVILSPTPNHFTIDPFFSNVKIYVNDQLYVYPIDIDRIKGCIDNILNIEKPDIIIGHSLMNTASIIDYALTVRDVPVLTFIWGIHCCARNFKNAMFKQIFFDNLKVLKKTNFLLTTNKVLTEWCIKNYGITRTDIVNTCPPVNLKQYINHIPNRSIPRLLLGKARREEYAYASLPAAFKKFPKLEVYAFNAELGVSLAKKFGIFNKIKYYDYPMSQIAFSDLIKKVNIVYTITPDPGTGATAMQASYAGCINLMRRCETSGGMLDDGKNVIMCNMNNADVCSKLIYSIENLDKLCKLFKKNNKSLIQYDRDNTWNAFYQAIICCLDGKKAKINPTYRV